MGRRKRKGKHRLFHSTVNPEISHVDMACIFFVPIPLTGTWLCQAARDAGKYSLSMDSFIPSSDSVVPLLKNKENDY